MSDGSEDNPFHSEPDYYPIYPEIMGNDDEHWQEESTETWQPEILQIMDDHGFSPEDFKEEEEELNTEEEPEGAFVILLWFYPFADMTCHWR